ncbi:MAG: metal-dependent hydrolase [Andreesenia angusta]|nr:metal-dependent hydrolase [Andreesenia angusta]
MDYKNHLKTGAIAGVLVIFSLYRDISIDPAEIVIYSAGIVIGSALPDIDHPGSLLARKLNIFGKLISKIFSHRGFTHSLLFIIILIIIKNIFKNYFDYPDSQLFEFGFLGIIVGSSMHIFMDLFVGNGTKLLFPIYKKKIYISKIKSGTKLEAFFIKLVLIVLCILLLYYNDKIII